jgi:hypothetical protein
VVLEKGKNRGKKNKRKGRQYNKACDVGIWRKTKEREKGQLMLHLMVRKEKKIYIYIEH